MKAKKKTQKRLDARINDYSKTMSQAQPPNPGSFHCPGSRKKIH